MKFQFSLQIFEKAQISSFIKIRPMGAELFHADRRTERQTDMTKRIVAFRNFAKAPKNLYYTERFFYRGNNHRRARDIFAA
jgi:hypothetical protein